MDPPDYTRNLVILAAEAVLVAALLLTLFGLRRRLGLTPLYVTIGVFQFLQVVLVMSVYVPVAPGMWISPGSAILFTAGLFAVLVVYIREDAAEARTLIYALVLANVCVSGLSALFGQHLARPGTLNPMALPPELFLQNPRVLLAGTLALLVDVLLIIVVYEAMSRVIRRAVFLRIYLTMATILLIDTLIFVSGSFLGEPSFGSMLVAGTLGKLATSFIYTTALVLYLRYVEPRVSRDQRETTPRDVFHFLTYRQRFEALVEQAQRDPLTGLFNRGFFDEAFPMVVQRAARTETPVSLLLVDLDHFKQINDRFGHQAGDSVLRCFGCLLKARLRSSDIAARYGGEEFALVLPGSTKSEATAIAGEVMEVDFGSCKLTNSTIPRDVEITMTIGVASSPEEASSAETLIRLADSRLYAGKRGGRTRVVSDDVA